MNIAIGAVLVTAVVGLVACSPLAVLNATIGSDHYQLAKGLQYGSKARQRLDVYRPVQQTKPQRVVVFFYGGSWKRGQRAHYRFVGAALTSRGFIAVVPDYRVYPEVRFPDFVHDGALVVRWVQDNIAIPGEDPAHIYLMGHSAGAHIAALLALDDRYQMKAGFSPKTVRAMVGLAGPYAFDPLAYASIRPIFEGTEHSDDARPVTFANGSAPPMLLLHGTQDTTVSPKNSKQLADALVKENAHARYQPYSRVGHVGILLALATPFRERAPVLEDAAAFIEKH